MARRSSVKQSASKPPRRSLKLAHWSLVVTLLILVLMLLPYVQRW
jgi:hypothetical protein